MTLIALAAAFFLAGARPARAEDAAPKGALPDVLIQAEQNKPVSREKPALRFDVKEDMALEPLVKTEDAVRLRLPSEVARSTPFAAGLSNSSLVAAPSRNRIILLWRGEAARVFLPAQELTGAYKEREAKSAQARWELVVADAAGGVFRKFEGSGLPPPRLDFDGKSDNGKWLKVGQVYTSVLTYRDGSGRAHTAMGRPFSLKGLAVQANDGFVISLDPQAVFEKDGAAYRLSALGRDLLAEAAQIIQRYHPGLGLGVLAAVSWPDGAAARQAATDCSQEIARRLALPVSAVSAEGKAGTPDLERRIDIQILNR